MTTMYIREFSSLANTPQSDSILAYQEDGTAVDSQVVYTAGAASHTFLPTTRWVTVRVDSICSFVISPVSNPVAAAITNMRLSAGERYDFAIPQPQVPIPNGKAVPTYQISAITNPV